MPLFVNETALTELATLTGVKPELLKSELFVEAEAEDKVPKTTKIKEAFSEIVIIGKTALDLQSNSKFDEGKSHQTLQLVKTMFGDKAFDTTGMTREQVAEKVKEQYASDSGKSSSEKEKELAESIRKLQGVVLEEQGKVKTLTTELESTKTISARNEKIADVVGQIPLAAKGEILLSQQSVLKNILSSLQLKNENGVDVYYENDVRLVDNLQNPLSLREIAKGKAIIFPINSSDNGRGDDSSNHNNQSGNLDAELKKATTTADLNKLLTARGLSPVSEEGRAVVSKWAEIHKKA